MIKIKLYQYYPFNLMMDDINFGLMDWKKWIQDSLAQSEPMYTFNTF